MHDRLADHKAWKRGKKKRLHFLIFKHKHGLKKVIARFQNRTVGIDHQHLRDAKAALDLHLSRYSVTKKKKENFLQIYIHTYTLPSEYFSIFPSFNVSLVCCVRYVLLQPSNRTKTVDVFDKYYKLNYFTKQNLVKGCLSLVVTALPLSQLANIPNRCVFLTQQ